MKIYIKLTQLTGTGLIQVKFPESGTPETWFKSGDTVYLDFNGTDVKYNVMFTSNVVEAARMELKYYDQETDISFYTVNLDVDTNSATTVLTCTTTSIDLGVTDYHNDLISSNILVTAENLRDNDITVSGTPDGGFMFSGDGGTTWYQNRIPINSISWVSSNTFNMKIKRTFDILFGSNNSDLIFSNNGESFIINVTSEFEVSSQTGTNIWRKDNSDGSASLNNSIGPNEANGLGAVCTGGNNKANGTGAVVLGGGNNEIPSGITNSAIIGMVSKTATESNTTYVDKFNIKTLGTNTPIKNLGVDANGTIVEAATGSSPSFEGRIIYVDSLRGHDNTDTGRGLIDLPYASLSYAQNTITDNIISVTGDTTLNDNTISGISDTDFAKMKLNQRIFGSGIPYNSKITNLIGGGSNNNSIEIDKLATITATGVPIKILNKYLIKVLPGNYEVTSTLGKESVSWYFEPNTYVSSSITIFGLSSSSTDVYDGFSVFGYGIFESEEPVYSFYQNNINTIELVNTFECISALSTGYTTITMHNVVGTNSRFITKGSIKSTASYAVNLYFDDGYYTHYGSLYSTTHTALVTGVYQHGIKIIGDYVLGDTYGISGAGFTTIDCDINYCTGYKIIQPYWYHTKNSIWNISGNVNQVNFGNVNRMYTKVFLNGKFNIVNLNYQGYGSFGNPGSRYTETVLNGTIGTCNLYDGKLIGGFVSVLYQYAGISSVSVGFGKYYGDSVSNNKTIQYGGINYYYGGVHTLTTENYQASSLTNGGIARVAILDGLTVNVTIDGQTYNKQSSINYPTFTILRGKLKLKGTHKADNQSIVYNNGGDLVLDGATLISNGFNPTISNRNLSTSLQVLSGGVNTNQVTGELLSAKKWKEKITIALADLTTSISLSDGTNSSNFEVNNPAVSRTKIELAGDLASLINAGTLTITATDNGDGTLDIESDTAGANCSSTSLVNCTSTILRYNSYVQTNITGGTIIENINITF